MVKKPTDLWAFLCDKQNKKLRLNDSRWPEERLLYRHSVAGKTGLKSLLRKKGNYESSLMLLTFRSLPGVR